MCHQNPRNVNDPNATDIAATRRRLLEWYDEHRRDLPWRETGDLRLDPYRVWLSEAMLQQTRVQTVIPYYRRWIERFPTLESLAEASLDEVLKMWEGLGYYSRARNLHRAVREVRESYGGRVPDDPAAFRALPGVGRYTAGAVLSIAFGRQEPVVDGNVRRVFARWTDSPEPAEGALWELAERLVRGERPGALNQGLMELGATVCTPRNPRCDACPVAGMCAARAAGTQALRPLPRQRGPLPLERRVAAVVESEAGFLLARRGDAGRLANLWEFPGGLIEAAEAPSSAAVRILPRATGVSVAIADELAVVRHTFTHLRVDYHVTRGHATGGRISPDGYQEVAWMRPADLERVAMPVAQRRIAALAAAAAVANE